MKNMKNKQYLVTEYINPNDPDGQKLIIPNIVNENDLNIAASHFGCNKNNIITRNLTMTNEDLNKLPEYEG